MSDPMDFACTVDGQKVDDTNRLRVLRMDEIEGELSPPLPDEAISRLEQVRDEGLYAQLLRLTPDMWREMGPARRRLMLDFTVGRIQLFEEKAAFMSRNIVVGEIELPDYLRQQGAA